MQALRFRGLGYGGGLLRGPGDFVSRVISTLDGVTPIITLLRTDLQSPLNLQVGLKDFGVWGLRFRGLGVSL